MRTINVSATNELGVLLDEVQIVVEDEENRIALVPLAVGRDMLDSVNELTIGLPPTVKQRE